VCLAEAVAANAGIDALGPERRYVVPAEATTVNGRTFSRDVEDRPGGPTRPMTAAQVAAKFDGLAAPRLGHEGAAALRRWGGAARPSSTSTTSGC